MKKENKIWALLAPVVVLSVIALVITAALALANQATAPVIAAAEQAKADAAMQVVLPAGADFQTMADLTALPESITAAFKAGNGSGYVFTVASKGFGGAMSIMLGIGADGKITGSQVISHGETAGIGTKVMDDNTPFQQQLVGLSDPTAIQATSGATVSSNAFKAAAESALTAYVVASGGTVEVKVAQAPANLTDEVLAGYYPGATFTEVPGGKTSDAGTVVYAAEAGMMGPVPVAVCFDTNGAIIGVVVDAATETPGLGDLCAESSYTDQFIGVANADEVDAISGSTMTSNGVKDGVNAAIANLSTVKGAG